MGTVRDDGGREKMIPVTTERPCPVCDKPDWCLVATDGTTCICQRVEAGGKKKCGDAGWLHVLLDRPRSSDPPRTTKRAKGKSAPAATDWPALAERYARAFDADGRNRLAVSLGLPEGALDTWPVGLRADDPHRACTTWPEADAAGRITGINRRWNAGTGPLVNGERSDKRFLPGGKRGLTLPTGWCGRPGPVFVVEGPTDAALPV